MDTMRGYFGSFADTDRHDDAGDDAVGVDTSPLGIGQDERRMQVRAYNHWASLLGERNFPGIEDLEPANLPDFGPHSVLLDFTNGIEDPGIAYVGAKLGQECGIGGENLQALSEVPARSLLTRITDHYMQILANQAPIGFEAEFVNQRGSTIMYRGILLPFSSDDDTIDFIYGVINWKELADAQSADELLLEIDQALEPRDEIAPHHDAALSLTDWADGPGAVATDDTTHDAAAERSFEQPGQAGYEDANMDNVLPLPSFGHDNDAAPEPGEASELASFHDDEDTLELDQLLDDDDDFGDEDLTDEEEDDVDGGSAYGSLLRMPLELTKTSEKVALALPELDPEDLNLNEMGLSDMALSDMGLSSFEPAHFESAAAPVSDFDPADMELEDWLAAAQQMAAAAHNSEDRTRSALYDAIGRAYDFSLAASEAPREFEDLLAQAELTMQDRAPMTPVVKLVFGSDYDKTRLTEYAAALHHAHRLELPLGTLGTFLGGYEGGLKAVVKAERRIRREEAGKTVEPLDAPRQALARKLRDLPAQDFASIAAEGPEFALVMIRRTPEGEVQLLGEVPDDVALVERAAKRLIG